MDDFVRNKLTEWGFSDLIQTFKDEEIDQDALCCLDHHEIDKLINKAGKRAKFKNKLKLLQSQQECQEAAHCDQVLPSTSGKVKCRLEPHVEENKNQTPSKRPRHTVTETSEEDRRLCEVIRIMNTVRGRLQNHKNTELTSFLRMELEGLQTDERETIGVFGKTGAGKSSLINVVIGEKHLLPSGEINACTAVMIKVEANTQNHNYEAHIEFITKEEWNDELFWAVKTLSGDDEDEEGEEDDKPAEDDDESGDNEEKLTAVYGEEWKNKSAENLMDPKYFKDVPEFLKEKKKILSCMSAKELSKKCLKYTISGSKSEGERFFWPLVKCVTVKVPNNELLQHVTLVDLPGNGDRNKSRDQMWKGIVGGCSTVWIVAGINRLTAERDTWDILKSACRLMGNGGECQNIHFICTKTDTASGSENSEAGVLRILKNNMDAKKQMKQEFNKLKGVKRQFGDDCFEVFTVSAREFLKPTHLKPEETEIPELQDFLQRLNDQHSETSNYVSRAYGILSLMKAARCGDAAAKPAVCEELLKKVKREKEKVKKSMKTAYEALKMQLDTAVDSSKTSCDSVLKKIIYPHKRSGRGFHRELKCVVKNNGVNKRGKNKKEININMTLASLLSEKIDEEFRNTFPNDRNSGPFYGAINRFTLDTETLIHNYKDVELQLRFLKTEEEKMKEELRTTILRHKKAIYNSLVGTIEKTMQECYTRAAEVRGKDTLKNMREIIEKHLYDSKLTMFDLAKKDMLNQLSDLMGDILETLADKMQGSINASLKMNDTSIPDISAEYSLVEGYYKQLKGPEEDTSSQWLDSSDESMDC